MMPMKTLTTNTLVPSQTLSSSPPTELPPLPFLYAESDAVWYGISFWAVVSCHSHVSLQYLVHLQPAHWWDKVRNRKVLWHCGNTAQQ